MTAGRMSIVGVSVMLAALAGCDSGTPSSDAPADRAGGPESDAALDPTPFAFTDVTTSSGLDMTWTSGATPTSQILEAKGGGVALIDYDRDGDLDVFVPNGATMDAPDAGPGARLFANDSTTDGLRFRDVTREAGITLRRWGIGVAVGDYDGDGHDDLYVPCYGRNALLRNTGDGRFEDVTEHAGVGDPSWSAAAAFGDVDQDGDLDLYVANYLDFDTTDPPPISSFKGAPVFKGPIGLTPQPDVLYENLGDGTFRDASVASGVRAVDAGYGLGVVILDFTGDGTPDIYVGNDSTANFLFEGRPADGAPRFEDIALRNGLSANVDGSTQSTMGIAIGDVSGNRFPDVFTTNFSNDSNTLHVNKDGRFFDDETRRYGVGMVSFPYVGWAAGLYDFDQDADEDLLLFNGHVYANATVKAMDAEYDEPPLLYTRDGDRFRRVTGAEAGPWLDAAHCDRGAAFGDLDGDGDVDVVVVELNGPVRVLRNDGARPGGSLIVELEPPHLGAVVDARFTDDERTHRRWIYSGGSFASASAQSAHFGCAPGATANLEITWPDGHRQRVNGVATGGTIRVARDDAARSTAP